MQVIIDACRDGRIAGEVAVVVGVVTDAPAIHRAQAAGVETIILNPKEFDDVAGYDRAMLESLVARRIDLVCLAGYMRVLGKVVVEEFRNRIMNTHPALIPMFSGKGMYGHHVHEAAIARGVKISGCTVHFVDEDYDMGPIIVQTPVVVCDDDTVDSLAARILAEEHQAYVQAIKLFAEGRLEVDGRRVRIKPAQ